MPHRRHWQRASRTAWAVALLAVLVETAHVASGSRLGVSAEFWTTWLPSVEVGWCALAALLGAAGAQGGTRVTRLLLGLGMACYAPGNAIYLDVVARGSSQTFPTIADYCWLAFYPLALASVIFTIKRFMKGRSPVILADASIGALTALAVGSVLLLDLVLKGVSLHENSVGSIVYSLADQLLVGASIGSFAVFGWRPPRAMVVLTIGLLLQTVEDTIYLSHVVHGSYPSDGWSNVLWLTNFALISAATVFPRPIAAPPPEEQSRNFISPTVIFALVLVAVTTVIMSEPRPWVVSIAVASGGLLMVVSRMGLALQSNLRHLREARDDSRTDPLTDLGNRRDLQEMVEVELTGGLDTEALTLAIYDLDGFKSYNDSYGHPAGDALLRRLSLRLKASVPPPGRAFRLGGDEFCVLLPGRAGDAQDIVQACHEALSESGDAFYVTNSYGSASIPEDAADLRELLTRADRRLYAMKMGRPFRGQGNSVALLRRVLEETQPDVQNHQTEVARLAIETGKLLGLSESELLVLASAAEFHDVGKVAIPDSILNKPGPLDPDEWVYMRRHTMIGERFLIAVPGMEDVARIVRSSHERIDGHGYPDGLAGNAIPLEARIISACDAYHAMTTERPYNQPRSTNAALGELRRCAGTQFDARVVGALERVVVAARAPLAAAEAA